MNEQTAARVAYWLVGATATAVIASIAGRKSGAVAGIAILVAHQLFDAPVARELRATVNRNQAWRP